MKTKLLLRTSIIIYFTIFTIQNLGMLEKEDILRDNDTNNNLLKSDILEDNNTNIDLMKKNNMNNVNDKDNEDNEGGLNMGGGGNNINININLLGNNNMNNVDNNDKKNKDKKKPILINIVDPFKDTKDPKGKSIAFYRLFLKVERIYMGLFGIVLTEIVSSLGLSIVNNIIDLEKMVKNKFYVNMPLLKFGYKRTLPLLNFLILDFNISIYNLIATGLKVLSLFVNRIAFKPFNIDPLEPIKKGLVVLFNIFNIDIKINIPFFSLSIPLTKVLEFICIYKGLKNITETEQNTLPIADVEKTSNTYREIYRAADQQCKEVHEFLEQKEKEYNNLNQNLIKINTKLNKEIFKAL